VPPAPDLSIIIPTCNRPESLDRLLDSLAAVDTIGAFEVLVVDNGPSAEAHGSAKWTPAKPSAMAVKFLREKEPGKARALNLGLSAANGKVLLFLDDDVVVAPDCATQHLAAYKTTGYDALQGRILPGRDPSGATADLAKLREYNIPYIDYGSEIRDVRGLTGTNMSFKRAVFEKVGFFDTRLGPGAAGFSEDTEYSIRIRKAGFKIGYTPHPVVFHELNPRRYGRAYNRMVEYRKGLSRSLYRRDSILFHVFPDLLANCIRYGIYRAFNKTQKAYKTEGRIWKSWGYVMGKMRGIETRDRHSEI